MSKSRGNTVSPDELIDEMGADTERVYTLFLGPPEDEVEWNDEAVSGAYRFLGRLWRVEPTRSDDAPPIAPADAELERLRHLTIQRVTRDLRALQVQHRGGCADGAARTAWCGRSTRRRPRKICCEATLETLLQLLHPMAPHVTEELWERRGHGESLLESAWPAFDRGEAARASGSTLVVQVDGKLRDRVEVDIDASESEVARRRSGQRKGAGTLAGQELAKAVVVPGRLVNLVTRRTS